MLPPVRPSPITASRIVDALLMRRSFFGLQRCRVRRRSVMGLLFLDDISLAGYVHVRARQRVF